MKYNNKFTTVDGIRFQSKKEANRYTELKLLEKHKHIKNLELQPKFELIPKYEINGRKVRATKKNYEKLWGMWYYETEEEAKEVYEELRKIVGNRCL